MGLGARAAYVATLALFACGCGRIGLLDDESELGAGNPRTDAGARLPDAGARDAATHDAGTVMPRDGGVRVDPRAGASLDGLRWELPCEGTTSSPSACTTPATRTVTATMNGAPGATYRVTLRFRGVVERQVYPGGVNDGRFFVRGGAPSSPSINVYSLSIGPQVAYLNATPTPLGRLVYAIDYIEVFSIPTGATVTLQADSRDGAELRNLGADGAPIVVPAVAPAPDAFDGQFIQMDVMTVESM